MCKELMKDEKLNYLVENSLGNIAQFISYVPGSKKPKYVYIKNDIFNKGITQNELIFKLIESAPSKSVNIRSYSKMKMKGNDIIMNKGIDDIDEIVSILNENIRKENYVIINENIDIADGGVSGVVLGNIIEFSPEDTPKCVEKEGICSLPRDIGMNLLNKVYGFKPEINFNEKYRVEFSLHPKPQGLFSMHTNLWEYEYVGETSYKGTLNWPNNFSRFIGDKAFGLLLASLLDLDVPKTTVIGRNIAPFSFGRNTGSLEKWIRTCPVEKQPGKYYTGSEWIDPFSLMNKEDPEGKNIVSILSQDAVKAVYSGGAFIRKDFKDDIIEGVRGTGENFMVGEQDIERLPKSVIQEVEILNNRIRSKRSIIGDVSIEWVYDGQKVWIVQLNQLKMNSKGLTIVEGDVKEYIDFDVSKGLEALRELIKNLKDTKSIGINLVGKIGITSHFGDLLRISNTPSKISNKS